MFWANLIVLTHIWYCFLYYPQLLLTKNPNIKSSFSASPSLAFRVSFLICFKDLISPIFHLDLQLKAFIKAPIILCVIRSFLSLLELSLHLSKQPLCFPYYPLRFLKSVVFQLIQCLCVIPVWFFSNCLTEIDRIHFSPSWSEFCWLVYWTDDYVWFWHQSLTRSNLHFSFISASFQPTFFHVTY